MELTYYSSLKQTQFFYEYRLDFLFFLFRYFSFLVQDLKEK